MCVTTYKTTRGDRWPRTAPRAPSSGQGNPAVWQANAGLVGFFKPGLGLAVPLEGSGYLQPALEQDFLGALKVRRPHGASAGPPP